LNPIPKTESKFVVPAEAGIQLKQSLNPITKTESKFVVPAEAGIQLKQSLNPIPKTESKFVVPAEAGIQPIKSSGRAANKTVFASRFYVIPTGLSRAGFPPPRERQLFSVCLQAGFPLKTGKLAYLIPMNYTRKQKKG